MQSSFRMFISLENAELNMSTSLQKRHQVYPPSFSHLSSLLGVLWHLSSNDLCGLGVWTAPSE